MVAEPKPKQVSNRKKQNPLPESEKKEWEGHMRPEKTEQKKTEGKKVERLTVTKNKFGLLKD